MLTLPDGTKEFYISDNNGTARAVVSYKASQTGVRTYDYGPFGETLNGGDNRIGYGGKQLDAESSLYAMGARMYNAETGRFTQPDPLLEMFPSQSPYSFAFNNPINFSDPSGMAPIKEKGDKVQAYQFPGVSLSCAFEQIAYIMKPPRAGYPFTGKNNPPETPQEDPGEQLPEEGGISSSGGLPSYCDVMGAIGGTIGVGEPAASGQSSLTGDVGSPGVGSNSGVSYYEQGVQLGRGAEINQGRRIGDSFRTIHWQDLFMPGYLTHTNLLLDKLFFQAVNDVYITGQSILKTAGYQERPILAIDGYIVNGNERTDACMNTLVAGFNALYLKLTGKAAQATKLILRPDITLSGGRSGQLVKNLTGPANSVLRGNGNRIFITNESGQIIWI